MVKVVVWHGIGPLRGTRKDGCDRRDLLFRRETVVSYLVDVLHHGWISQAHVRRHPVHWAKAYVASVASATDMLLGDLLVRR